MTSVQKPDRLELARLEKLEKIQALGRDPWGQRFDNHSAIADVRARCPEQSGTDGDTVRIAGRIMGRRKAGKLRFIDLQDQSGTIQLLCSRGDMTEPEWKQRPHESLVRILSNYSAAGACLRFSAGPESACS